MRKLLPLLAASALMAQTGATVFVAARVADGTGRALVVESVRVVAGRIDRIGAFPPSPGDTVIHAEGLVLAPGFIDTHNHSGAALDTEPGA
ncbi:MAG: D-aminoacylase, partial [Bryobacteraceae bacterium]